MKTLIPSFSLVALTLCAVGCQQAADPGPACNDEEVGILCTIAGNGENGYDRNADDVSLPALETKFSLPQDTLTAADGTIYIVDWNNHRLRTLVDGKVSWVAGSGELGGDLDDPENGDFNHPTNVIFDQNGENIIIAAWHNSKIRVLDPVTREVTDFGGDGRRAYFGDAGPALTASFDLPASIAYDPQGNLVVMDQANQVLRHIDKEGMTHLRAGQCVIDAPAPNGPGACAEGVEPVQCPGTADSPSGKFTCGDPMTTCSRPCTPGYAGDDGPATEMRMSQPFGQAAPPAGRIAFDGEGNLYFADTSNHLIRMIDSRGIVRRVAGVPPVDGAPVGAYSGDGGPATEAQLNMPVDLAFGDDGTLYFSDVSNHCIRAIYPDGIIDTVVGTCGQPGYDGNGGPAEDALLNLPFGVEFVDGKLLVTDTGNNMIRSVVLP